MQNRETTRPPRIENVISMLFQEMIVTEKVGNIINVVHYVALLMVNAPGARAPLIFV